MVDFTLPREYIDDMVVRMAHHSTAIEGNTLTQGEAKSIILDNMIPRKMGLIGQKVCVKTLMILVNI